jgi:4-amino-4-deoxy-L-arabinose transferase-like glycosyltransferase
VTAIAPEVLVLPDEVTAQPLLPSPPTLTRPSRLRIIAPLGLVLMIQTLLSLRGSGAATRTESTLLGPTPPGSHLANTVGTLPGIYPVVAHSLAALGGLELARAFSLLCAAGATVLVFGFARRLFGELAGVLAAAVFGSSVPILALGHVAVPDAPAMLLLALAARLLVVRQGGAVVPDAAGPVLAGVAAALAAIVSYPWLASSLVLAPLAFTGLPSRSPRSPTAGRERAGPRALAMLAGFGATMAAAAVLDRSFLGQMVRSLYVASGTNGTVPTTLLRLVETVGPFVALAAIGAVLVAGSSQSRRTVLQAALLLAASIVGGLYVFLVASPSALLEHDAWVMVFLAPLCGAALAGSVRARGTRTVLPVLGILVAIVSFSAASVGADLQWASGATPPAARHTAGGTKSVPRSQSSATTQGGRRAVLGSTSSGQRSAGSR